LKRKKDRSPERGRKLVPLSGNACRYLLLARSPLALLQRNNSARGSEKKQRLGDLTSLRTERRRALTTNQANPHELKRDFLFCVPHFSEHKKPAPMLKVKNSFFPWCMIAAASARGG